MKEVHIKLFTIVGLVTVVLLQTSWLYNTYTLIETSIKEKSNTLILEATDRELFSRFSALNKIMPSGTELSIHDISEDGEFLSKTHYIQETFLKYGSELSLTDIDSIYSHLLETEDIYAKSVVNIVTENDSIIKSSKEWKTPFFGTITTKKIPIRINHSQNIQAVIINPYWAIFQQMGLLLIATIVMAIFVVTCIAYQIRIIIRQNRIAQMREDFSNAMIHDMKSPITSIIMGTRALRSGRLDNLPDRKAKYFNILEDESDRLLTLTNKVLTISRLEQAKLTLNKQEVQLRPIIDDLIEKIEAKNIKPITFTTIYEVEVVHADPEYFKAVISNLIDNAIKYSNETVEITITCTKHDHFTLIKVKDNGFGIAIKDQTKIFEKFERAAALGRSRKGGATGFGLGLNYVQRVIIAHGGNVDIESIEGQYSEFTVSLPILIQEI